MADISTQYDLEVRLRLLTETNQQLVKYIKTHGYQSEEGMYERDAEQHKSVIDLISQTEAALMSNGLFTDPSININYGLLGGLIFATSLLVLSILMQ
jgi:hypothetical protein